jgi:dTDP-4-dehydrorhamnose reductase
MTARLLVIGRTGQLATALQAEPPPAGWSVVALGRDILDLAATESADAILAEYRPTVIVNAAGYTAVDKAESQSRLAYAVNATGPGRLARAAAKHGSGFIQLSTDYVFDGAKPGLWQEDDPVGPLGIYGASKLAGELSVAAAHPRALILRTSWVFSATGSNFVRTMLRLARTRPALAVVDDQIGRPTAATSLARAIVAALPQLADGVGTGQLLHLSNDGPITSWHGFAQAIFASAGMRPEVQAIASADYPTAARRPANSALAIDRFVATFGHRPPSWQEALGDVMGELARAGEA